jgi:hypothetical protein
LNSTQYALSKGRLSMGGQGVAVFQVIQAAWQRKTCMSPKIN